MRKKGQVAIYMTFIIAAIVVITIGALVAPMGSLFNTKMFEAGEMILEKTNESVQNIQHTELKEQIQASTDNALIATANNIEVNNALFQWSWVLVLGMVALTSFLYTRRVVEYGAGGFI